MNERDLLESYRPWLRKVAVRMTTPDLAEDLAQEGWIAIWRAVDLWDGRAPLDWWLKRKAHGRMITCVARDWKTAKATQDVPTPDEDLLWEQLTVDLGRVELAYHQGTLYAALAALTPREREYVFLRFWCGWKAPQMREHFGYEPNGLWRTSKIKLTESLAPLEALHV